MPLNQAVYDDIKWEYIFGKGTDSEVKLLRARGLGEQFNKQVARSRENKASYTLVNPYCLDSTEIGRNMYNLYGPNKSGRLDPHIFSFYHRFKYSNNFKKQVMDVRGIDIDSRPNRFATILYPLAILPFEKFNSIIASLFIVPWLLVTLLIATILLIGEIVLRTLFDYVKSGYRYFTNPNISLLKKLMTGFLIAASITLLFSLVANPFLGLAALGGFVVGTSILKNFSEIPKILNNFKKCFFFSTIDKGNIPYPSKYKANDTFIMEMGVPVYLTSRLQYKVEPIFESALESFAKDKKKWLYVNYLENKSSESRMIEALKGLETRHKNFYYMQVPPHNQLAKLIKNSGHNGRISKEALIKEIVHDNRFFCIGTNIRKELKKKQLEEIVNEIIETLITDGTQELSFFQLKKFSALLTEKIREEIKPHTMNFTCKDGIDRGHVGKLEYLMVNGLANHQEAFNDRHMRALQVKGRKANAHVTHRHEGFEAFCEHEFKDLSKYKESHHQFIHACPYSRKTDDTYSMIAYTDNTGNLVADYDCKRQSCTFKGRIHDKEAVDEIVSACYTHFNNQQLILTGDYNDNRALIDNIVAKLRNDNVKFEIKVLNYPAKPKP